MKKLTPIFLLLLLGSCAAPDVLIDPEENGMDPGNQPVDSTSETLEPETTDQESTCNFWEIGCNQAAPAIVDDDDQSDSDGNSEELPEIITDEEPTLAELLEGSWSGEYQWDVSSKRLLYITYTKYTADDTAETYYTENGGTMSFVINPYGPNRLNWTGYWEVDEDNSLRMYDYNHSLQYIWHDVQVVTGKYFTFTNVNQVGTLKMNAGITLPEEGLVGEVFVFSEDQEKKVFSTTGMLWWDQLYFDGILLMARNQSTTLTPVCSDWTYGVTQINMNGGPTFNIGQITGFDRYGGSKCKNYTDRFILDLYGSINIPAGSSNIRFNTENKEVDDGAILFINDYNKHDGVLTDLDSSNAVICNADDYDIECLNEVQSPLNYQINGGTTGGWLPIELVYVELDENVYLNLELAVGSNTNYAPISAKRLTYPTWWR